MQYGWWTTAKAHMTRFLCIEANDFTTLLFGVWKQ